MVAPSPIKVSLGKFIALAAPDLATAIPFHPVNRQANAQELVATRRSNIAVSLPRTSAEQQSVFTHDSISLNFPQPNTGMQIKPATEPPRFLGTRPAHGPIGTDDTPTEPLQTVMVDQRGTRRRGRHWATSADDSARNSFVNEVLAPASRARHLAPEIDAETAPPSRARHLATVSF
ncbi:MAG: hypothetical protein Q3974_06335 [Rothia sp. (in: high G+C Gram-positive bacteria)]|nr:hypothetical protein [Rothia sp. (in: high G+C Gram-positive bacteria)]